MILERRMDGWARKGWKEKMTGLINDYGELDRDNQNQKLCLILEWKKNGWMDMMDRYKDWKKEGIGDGWVNKIKWMV